jgi:hypothetical protein
MQRISHKRNEKAKALKQEERDAAKKQERKAEIRKTSRVASRTSPKPPA